MASNCQENVHGAPYYTDAASLCGFGCGPRSSGASLRNARDRGKDGSGRSTQRSRESAQSRLSRPGRRQLGGDAMNIGILLTDSGQSERTRTAVRRMPRRRKDCHQRAARLDPELSDLRSRRRSGMVVVERELVSESPEKDGDRQRDQRRCTGPQPRAARERLVRHPAAFATMRKTCHSREQAPGRHRPEWFLSCRKRPHSIDHGSARNVMRTESPMIAFERKKKGAPAEQARLLFRIAEAQCGFRYSISSPRR